MSLNEYWKHEFHIKSVNKLFSQNYNNFLCEKLINNNNYYYDFNYIYTFYGMLNKVIICHWYSNPMTERGKSHESFHE